MKRITEISLSKNIKAFLESIKKAESKEDILYHVDYGQRQIYKSFEEFCSICNLIDLLKYGVHINITIISKEQAINLIREKYGYISEDEAMEIIESH